MYEFVPHSSLLRTLYTGMYAVPSLAGAPGWRSRVPFPWGWGIESGLLRRVGRQWRDQGKEK